MVLWNIWSCGFVLKSHRWQLESTKQDGTLTNEVQQSIAAQGALTYQQQVLMCSMIDGCTQSDPQCRTKVLGDLFSELCAVVSSTTVANQGNTQSVDPGASTSKPESLIGLAPILADVSRDASG